MATNLLDLVSSALTPDTVQGLSRFLGESDSAVQSGLGMLVPAVLGGMASKAATPGGAASLFSLINGANVDTNLSASLGSLLGGGAPNSLLQTGSALLGSLFGGDKTSAIAGALSGITGMKTGGASNMLMLAIPMIIGIIKRFIGENRLDASGLASLLQGQKGFLQGKLDPRITSALGLGSPASLLAGLGDTIGGTTAAAIGTVGTGAGSAAVAGRRWWPWLLAAIAALLLLTQLPRCSTTATRTTAPPTAQPATTTAVGSLPAKVYFDTGNAEPDANGAAVIKAVADMLASNAAMKVDVIGYTDRSGDAAANEELAKNRALNVVAALTAAGVAADRIGTKPPMFVEIGATGGDDAAARRVEITAQ